MAFSGTQITRLGLYGGPRGLYGSFLGKGKDSFSGVRRLQQHLKSFNIPQLPGRTKPDLTPLTEEDFRDRIFLEGVDVEFETIYPRPKKTPPTYIPRAPIKIKYIPPVMQSLLDSVTELPQDVIARARAHAKRLRKAEKLTEKLAADELLRATQLQEQQIEAYTQYKKVEASIHTLYKLNMAAQQKIKEDQIAMDNEQAMAMIKELLDALDG